MSGIGTCTVHSYSDRLDNQASADRVGRRSDDVLQFGRLVNEVLAQDPSIMKR